MAFILRSVQHKDIRDLQILATQFTLINLPNDLKALEKKVDISQRSFAGKIQDPSEREYLFVVEDDEQERVVGSSLILAKHGTPEHPHYYFRAKKIKLVPNKLIVTGPANLCVGDIPTPLYIPFGIFPVKQGRRSGIIFPQFGEDARNGFFIKQGGYFFAINNAGIGCCII